MFLKLVTGWVGIAISVLALGGCGSSGGEAAASTTAAADSHPKASPREALGALLEAEKHNDHATSFGLLSPTARETYKDVEDWTRLRSSVPAISGYSLQTAHSDHEAVAEVTHVPGLDPITGLSAAKETETWTAQHVKNGWLLEATPQIQPKFPSDSRAPEAAKQWAEAVQACDEVKAKSLQAVDTLFGSVSSAAGLCHSKDAVVTGVMMNAQSGPQTADLVAQYGSDVLQWARVVPVTKPVQCLVVLAPIGDEWKVIGLANNG